MSCFRCYGVDGVVKIWESVSGLLTKQIRSPTISGGGDRAIEAASPGPRRLLYITVPDLTNRICYERVERRSTSSVNLPHPEGLSAAVLAATPTSAAKLLLTVHVFALPCSLFARKEQRRKEDRFATLLLCWWAESEKKKAGEAGAAECSDGYFAVLPHTLRGVGYGLQAPSTSSLTAVTPIEV